MIAQPTDTNVKTDSKLPVAVANVIDNTTDYISSTTSSLSDSISNSYDYAKESVSSFGDKSIVNTSTDFLSSNTLVAKFSFILLVLIGFMILINLGVKAIGYFMKPKTSPYLISGTMNASNEVIIYQDPKNSDSIPILRSNNENTGIEFTWCIWIYINDVLKTPKYSLIFNKGNATYDEEGMATVNNGPGLYLDNTENNLKIVMNTVAASNHNEIITINDVPLRKWFHCAIRIENTALDVYVNGSIASRTILQDVPKQNYQNVNVCKNGGFNGNIADLQYFDKALSIFQLNNIVSWGRNQNASNAGGTIDATGFPYYLSNLWYSSNH
jgi:hypothetical protein